MEEHTPLQELEARLGAFEAMPDDQIPADEQMEFALHFLGWVRQESAAVGEPFTARIKQETLDRALAVGPYQGAEESIEAAIWEILEEHYPDQRHDGEAGRAQIVRPKNRILYDLKGLEVLRKSSDEVERLIGHLRDEKPSKPYLKVKLK